MRKVIVVVFIAIMATVSAGCGFGKKEVKTASLNPQGEILTETIITEDILTEDIIVEDIKVEEITVKPIEVKPITTVIWGDNEQSWEDF